MIEILAYHMLSYFNYSFVLVLFLFFSFFLSLSVSHLKSVTQKNINVEFQIWFQ